MLYLLQAPQPLSTNRSTPKLTPSSFSGSMDARASSYWRSPPLSHCPNTPFSPRAMHRQPPNKTASSTPPSLPHQLRPISLQTCSPVSSSLKNILPKKKKKILPWLHWQFFSNSMFLFSELFRSFYPKSTFSPSTHFSIHCSLIRSAETALRQGHQCSPDC